MVVKKLAKARRHLKRHMMRHRKHPLLPSVYSFKQNIDEFQIAGASANSYSGKSFTLQYLAQYATFTALFDQYRIDRIELTFRPVYNVNNFLASGTAGANQMQRIYTVVDYDDDASPTTLQQLEEYTNCKIHQYETFTISFVPHVANAVYSGAFTSFGNLRSPWIDCASSTVAHYGIKWGVTGSLNATYNQAWNVAGKMWVSFKNVR